MNKLSTIALLVVAATGAGAHQTDAAFTDPGYALYRCAVLGDSRVAVPTNPNATVADAGTRLVPGSHARYLIHLGWSEAQALAQAQRGGEQPRLAEVEPQRPPVQFSAHELYQRSVLGASEHAILRSRSRSSETRQDGSVAQAAAPKP